MNFASILQAIRNFFRKAPPSQPIQIATTSPAFTPAATANLPPSPPILTAPVPVTGTSVPNSGPTITDLLFRPTAEIGAIMDSRIGNTPSVEYPIVAVPTGFIQPIRLRCLLHGGIVYRSALNGFGLVISPTANDPAGQSAMYSAREVDANGNLIFDYGRVYKTMIVNKGSGIVEVSADTTSEVWYEIRG